jgi:erythromycin esterase
MVADATLVGLSEGVHCAAEPLEFRNRVLEYLVERRGFTAIAIESGIVESRVIHDYVRGAEGDLSTILARGISWGMHRLPQNRALVQWLRQYNAEHPGSRPVNFYGFDVPGSLASTDAVRRHDTALSEALQYLMVVDAAAGALFGSRLKLLMQSMHFTLHAPSELGGYERLSQSERDALTAAVADLVAWFERHEASYAAISTERDYAWAYRAAIGARQIDNWLRQIPIGWKPSCARGALEDALSTFYPAAADVRERAQADNLDWVLAQERGGRILVFASRYHLSSAPLIPSYGSARGQRAQAVAGTYLRRRFGSRWMTIGNLIGGGAVGCGDYHEQLPRAAAESLDGVAAQAGAPLFLLDLRTAPPPVVGWLNQERTLVAGSQTLTLPVGAAFDVLFYIDQVTPACSEHSTERLQR